MATRDLISKDGAPLLIAGGGPVSLCAAAFLAQRGTRSIAVALDSVAGHKPGHIVPTLNEGVEALSRRRP